MHNIFHILLVLEIKDTWLSITASLACTLLVVPISDAAAVMPFFGFNFFKCLMGMESSSSSSILKQVGQRRLFPAANFK